MEIPAVVIDRLPVYARALTTLETEGRGVISSQELGEMLGVTPAQIRKDLSYFGRFGKQGRGYNISRLAEELRQILGLNRQWSMVLIGVGNLGRAILSYDGFLPQGFRIIDAFDADPNVIGRKVGDISVRPIADLPAYLHDHAINIGIVAVPASAAREVVDTLVSGGVRAILNYAPIALQVLAGVQIREIDPVLSLQSMTYYLKAATPVATT